LSLCIAATCRFEDDQPCIVHCCDKAGTRGDVKSDDIIKIRNVGENTVLLAGNMGHARLLLSVCEPHIKGHPNGGDDLSITKLYQGLIKAVGARKRDVATAVLSAEMGFGWDEVFSFSQAHQNDPLWIDAWHKIRSLGLQAELIVSTFTDDEAAILVVEQNGNVAWPDHYAVIGTGSNIAQAFLHQRDYYDNMPVEDCIYRVLVNCPGDSFSNNATLRISVGPADGLSTLGVGPNILH
jgi:ATP-dependent protease HslVU (ClpYQ) peptidase subunit